MNAWITSKFKNLFSKNQSQKEKAKDIHFKEIILKEKTPRIDQLGDNEFVEVVYKGKSYWAIFKCPCGCSNVISLSLQKIHNPYWRIIPSKSGRPTVYPSIWQNIGCLSHFFIEDGKIRWCGNSGIEPWIAEPDYYNKPQK